MARLCAIFLGGAKGWSYLKFYRAASRRLGAASTPPVENNSNLRVLAWVTMTSTLSFAILQARSNLGVITMEDQFARGVAMGNSAILAHLMRGLVESGALPDEQVYDLLNEARVSLQRLQTDVAASAVGHVIHMAKAFTEANVRPRKR